MQKGREKNITFAEKQGENSNCKEMRKKLENLIARYRRLEIDRQIDYDKFCLYSLITHLMSHLFSTKNNEQIQRSFSFGELNLQMQSDSKNIMHLHKHSSESPKLNCTEISGRITPYIILYSNLLIP